MLAGLLGFLRFHLHVQEVRSRAVLEILRIQLSLS
jgi:hypothetical protein